MLFAMGATAVDMGLAIAKAVSASLYGALYGFEDPQKSSVFRPSFRFVLGEKAKEK